MGAFGPSLQIVPRSDLWTLYCIYCYVLAISTEFLFELLPLPSLLGKAISTWILLCYILPDINVGAQIN